MPNSLRFVAMVPLVLLLACSTPAAQSQQDVESLRKEVEALKASQAEILKSLEEVRTFLKEATGGRFGTPPIDTLSFDISGAPAFGEANAPVTLVEISDYHCPFCRRHVQQTQPQIYSEYVQAGKVRHVFVHYPIEQLHPEAFKSHEAASCAADQGRFWELHARLFERAVRTPEELTDLARTAGLDVAAFRKCLDSGKYAQEVRQSVERVQELGVSGTPMFLIGRTPRSGEPMRIVRAVQGAQPFPAFKQALDAVLAAQ